jgi:mRNA interferase MazF
MYVQGDIVSVPFPFTDLSSAKLRPAIVVSNNSIDITGDVIIVMVTSQYKMDGVNIPIGPNDIDIALPKQSYVRCHRIVTIDNDIIVNKIGSLSAEYLTIVLSNIKSIFDIHPKLFTKEV